LDGLIIIFVEKKLVSNRDPVIELAKEFGLSDEQIKAMNGMGSLLPPSVISRFRHKSPQKINEIVCRYAPIIMSSSQAFNESLGKPKELIEIDRKRIADLIAEKENYSNPPLVPQLRHGATIVKNPSPPQQHPDNSI
jgi:hypothetical protein